MTCAALRPAMFSRAGDSDQRGGSEMAKRVWVVMFIAAWATGLLLLATPSISQADTLTVTEIKVTVGGATFCGSTVAADCAGTHNIWTSALGGVGGAGISLTDGQSLVLTQTG